MVSASSLLETLNLAAINQPKIRAPVSKILVHDRDPIPTPYAVPLTAHGQNLRAGHLHPLILDPRAESEVTGGRLPVRPGMEN